MYSSEAMENNKTVLVFNNQALGDMLLGTHMATLIKKDHPSWNITFAIQEEPMLTMSTNDPDKGASEMVELLRIQPNIDNFGLLNQQTGMLSIISGQQVQKFDIMYHQSEWWSDLGAAASMQVPYYKDKGIEITRENIDTETKFNVNSKKELPSHLRVATAGPLDWNNKVKRDETRLAVLEGLYSVGISTNDKGIHSIDGVEVIQLGADMGNNTYLESLQILNNCHLYVGPEGSMSHMAAGLGVDTILVCSVYPPEMVAPAYYHSGNHYSVQCRKENHCGDYRCIGDKPYKDSTTQGWGNPPCKFTSWPSKCPYTPNKRSCVWNVDAEDIINKFKEWYEKDFIRS